MEVCRETIRAYDKMLMLKDAKDAKGSQSPVKRESIKFKTLVHLFISYGYIIRSADKCKHSSSGLKMHVNARYEQELRNRSVRSVLLNTSVTTDERVNRN